VVPTNARTSRPKSRYLRRSKCDRSSLSALRAGNPHTSWSISRCRSHFGGLQHTLFLSTGSVSFSDYAVRGGARCHPRRPGERRRSSGGKGSREYDHCHAGGRRSRRERALHLSVSTNGRSLDSDTAGASFATNTLGQSAGAIHDEQRLAIPSRRTSASSDRRAMGRRLQPSQSSRRS
jgi:hypothetical protein